MPDAPTGYVPPSLGKRTRRAARNAVKEVLSYTPVAVENGRPVRRRPWAIGMLAGPSPTSLAPLLDQPVLTHVDVTDVRAEFVADPFMIQHGDRWYMFFEVLNVRTGRGEIALASSDDALSWSYERRVLVEPFHLSYPFVFEWGGRFYLVPESYRDRSVRLYVASRFPFEWELVGPLLTGGVFLDSTIFHHDDSWWMFTETNPHHTYDTLRLFRADELAGPWVEHPSSPIIDGDARIARPGGRVVAHDGRLVRFTQACDVAYGSDVSAFEITELSPTTYAERALGRPMVASNGSWQPSRTHHIDAHELADGTWLACVDRR